MADKWQYREQVALDFGAGAYTLEIADDDTRRITGPTPMDNTGLPIVFGPVGNWLTAPRAEEIIAAIAGWWPVTMQLGRVRRARGIRSAAQSILDMAEEVVP